MKDLLEMTTEEYQFERKVRKLREKIRLRSIELNIQPDHTQEGHFYKFNGQRFPSVTGRLQILKDPGIMNWKMNRAVDYISSQWNSVRQYDPTQINAILTEAKLVPQKEFEGAGSIGTTVHGWREQWFKRLIEYNEDPKSHRRAIAINQNSSIISACRAVERFAHECNYIPLACELYVADEILKTGGQVDDIGFVNGELCLVDLKTSNIGDKESYYAQVALYYFMFRKLYRLRPEKLKILHVSKQDGTYKLIDIPDIQKTIQWAKKVVQVSQGLDEIKEAKKKKVMTL
jgi:hypothetical protein